MQSIDFDRGIWAVAATPSMGLVIGSLHFTLDLLGDDEEVNEQNAIPAVQGAILEGTPVIIDPCFGLKSDAFPVQTPQGPGMTMFRQAFPLANLQGPGKLHTRITSALLFFEMEEAERRRHKVLVEQLVAQLAAARAEQAGIKLAGPGDMPGGKRHS